MAVLRKKGECCFVAFFVLATVLFAVPAPPAVGGWLYQQQPSKTVRLPPSGQYDDCDCHGALERSFRPRRALRSSAKDSSSPATTTTTTTTTDAAVITPKDRGRGIAVLLTVPLCWGTYGPAVKYLYALQPPVPGLVFSAAYYAVASAALWLLVSIAISTTAAATAASTTTTIMDWENGTSEQQFLTAAEAVEEDVATTVDDSFPLVTAASTQQRNDDVITSTKMSSPFPWRGGIELGSYLFVANVLQVIGLQTVQADRAGFLVQLTTIMVPILEAALAANWTAVSQRTWLACFLAFAGVIVIDLDSAFLDGAHASVSSLIQAAAVSGFSNGDLLIVSAAVVYSWHVVRLERYAKETTALRLAASKACTEALLSIGLVAGLMLVAQGYTSSPSSVSTLTDAPSGLWLYVTQTGQEITSFFSTVGETLASGSIPDSVLMPAVAAVLWTGLVTCAYTIFAQSFGQGRVKPTQANLIYTVQPIFTALFAFVLLGETMGPAGIAGGSMIAAAVYMVATVTESEEGE